MHVTLPQRSVKCEECKECGVLLRVEELARLLADSQAVKLSQCLVGSCQADVAFVNKNIFLFNIYARDVIKLNPFFGFSLKKILLHTYAGFRCFLYVLILFSHTFSLRVFVRGRRFPLVKARINIHAPHCELRQR